MTQDSLCNDLVSVFKDSLHHREMNFPCIVSYLLASLEFIWFLPWNCKCKSLCLTCNLQVRVEFLWFNFHFLLLFFLLHSGVISSRYSLLGNEDVSAKQCTWKQTSHFFSRILFSNVVLEWENEETNNCRIKTGKNTTNKSILRKTHWLFNEHTFANWVWEEEK